jgi:hypothetical protein
VSGHVDQQVAALALELAAKAVDSYRAAFAEAMEQMRVHVVERMAEKHGALANDPKVAAWTEGVVYGIEQCESLVAPKGGAS